ncbi:hypothetical protein [Streptomyces sp. NPDC005435]|uniref:hypothetical protein n=1 Tax=Streptomyces sp. NPDC005435 TaxID=3154464 RepID=UPI0034549E0C
MRHLSADDVIWVLDWNPAAPAQLTTLAVSGEHADMAERTAASALAGTAGLTSWLDLPASLRRQLVRACRSVPALGLYCVMDEEPPAVPCSGFLRDAAADTVERFRFRPHSRSAGGLLLADPLDELRDVLSSPLAGMELWPHCTRNLPGLRELVRLTAVCCRETACTTDLPGDEDLLEIYDTFVVGGLGGAGSWS